MQLRATFVSAESGWWRSGNWACYRFALGVVALMGGIDVWWEAETTRLNFVGGNAGLTSIRQGRRHSVVRERS